MHKPPHDDHTGSEPLCNEDHAHSWHHRHAEELHPCCSQVLWTHRHRMGALRPCFHHGIRFYVHDNNMGHCAWALCLLHHHTGSLCSRPLMWGICTRVVVVGHGLSSRFITMQGSGPMSLSLPMSGLISFSGTMSGRGGSP